MTGISTLFNIAELSTSGQPSGHDAHGYLLRDNRTLKDTKTIDSAYDRYLRSAVIP